ncbi:MAG TPA: hypothetical protein VM889_14475 [Candidatus Thermoplasmatota archaeon]|nr:hypothetical protein [Candidatus Thermoplasmatota archaeon]
MAPGAPLAVATLLVTALLAGCIGGSRDDQEPRLLTPLNETGPNTTLPDDRPPSAGLAETNRTESGLGGVDHRHDYWAGRSVVTLYEGPVYLSVIPVFPDGEGSMPKSSAYVTLPKGEPPSLVYEGADRLEIHVGAPLIAPNVPHPAPPAMKVQWKTAMANAFGESTAITYGAPLEIKIKPRETDMPHSVSSLWAFRFTLDRSEELEYPVKILVFKGNDVVSWPGHPDFYADKSSRVVLQKIVKTKMHGIVGSYLYDAGGTWVNPEKLISHGTTRLDVFANVTKITSQTGQQATGYFLEHHNATVLGEEIQFGDRTRDKDGPQDGVRSWNFTIPVTPDGMDGPYQPESRWGFRLMATFANAAGSGLCPGCFDYEIEYEITVVASTTPGTKAVTM